MPLTSYPGDSTRPTFPADQGWASRHNPKLLKLQCQESAGGIQGEVWCNNIGGGLFQARRSWEEGFANDSPCSAALSTNPEPQQWGEVPNPLRSSDLPQGLDHLRGGWRWSWQAKRSDLCIGRKWKWQDKFRKDIESLHRKSNRATKSHPHKRKHWHAYSDSWNFWCESI